MQIFLDHNSTTPILDEVVDCMAECYRRGYGNPASQHAAGRQARRLVEDAREAISGMLGANLRVGRPDRLVFTSGGTESNNLAILGLAAERPGRLLVSAIEHPSVAGSAEFLAQRGWQLEQLDVDARGAVVIERIDELLGRAAATRHSPPAASPPLAPGSAGGLMDRGSVGPRAEPGARGDGWSAEAEGGAVVAVMLGNNETGVLQPVADLAAICGEHGARLHTDAVQVVGKLPINFAQLGVATLAFSAHKFHGPRGIGGLVVRGDVELRPILHGGFQQGGLRPGTEPVALVAGMHKALEIWQRECDERLRRLTALRDRFEAGILARVPSVIINGAQANRLPHTSNVSFAGLDRRALAMALDLEGVACSTGSACASGSSEPSPVLIAMGLAADVVAGSLRFSLGATTTEAEIDDAIMCVVGVVERLAKRV